MTFKEILKKQELICKDYEKYIKEVLSLDTEDFIKKVKELYGNKDNG